MEKASKTHRKGAGIAAVVALVMCLLALPALAQSPITLAGGGASVSFPPTPVGQSANVTVTLNVNVPVTLASLSATGDFALMNTSCNLPLALAAGDSCVLGISFTPKAPGPRWSPLLITDNNGTRYSFGLVGSGIGPILTFTPGIVSTVVGTGISGYTGDGGPALAAQIGPPMGLARDHQGNLYIADAWNGVVRKVSTDGIISTIAGNGTQGYSGDGGPATSAELVNPSSVALDGSGTLYIVDSYYGCMRKVDQNGTISTLVATGVARVVADGAGSVYYSGGDVWRLDPQGLSTRVAGNGTPGFSGDGGPATNAQISLVLGLALDSQGNLYLADLGNNDIRKIDTNGIITTVAGDQESGFDGDGGPATSARLHDPTDVQIDAGGNLYIADSYNGRIRKVNADGMISTIAGGNYGYAGDGGLASNAQFRTPAALAVDESGNLFIADRGNNVIREVKVGSTTLDFGTVNAGQTGGPLSVILSNAGNGNLNVTGIVTSSNFGVQTTCPASTGLLAGADCSVNVSFTPTAGGKITGTVNVSDDAPGHPHVVNLKGQGYVVPVGSQLVFATQLWDIPLNENLGVVIVNAIDPSGNLVTRFTGVVTVQLRGPAGFTTYSAQVNASGGTATFDLTAKVLNVAGSYTIIASSSGLISAQVSFMVENFRISTSKQSLTVGRSGAGSLSVTVTPTNGFSGTVALSCSGLPAHSTCSFAPASLKADGNDTPVLSGLTISTGVATTAAVHHAGDLFLFANHTGILSTGLLGLVFAPMWRGRRDSHHKRDRVIQLILVVIILCAGLIGCNALARPDQTTGLTPRGSYSVTITAASTDVSHSSTVTLVVQ